MAVFSNNQTNPNIQSIFWILQCLENQSNNFSKEQLKRIRIKDGTIIFWLHKQKDLVVQGSVRRSNNSSYWPSQLGYATESECSHLCKAPSTAPRVSSDLPQLLAMTGPNAPAKLVS